MLFMDEYKSRLIRINDRENHIFLSALVKHLNEDAFIEKLDSNEERREVLEMLINNAELFERGSA